jgi:molybdate transport system substrate-binding protein
MDAQSKRITLTTALVAIFSAFAVSAQAADIKVLSDGPIKPALTKVADLFSQETHTQVHMAFDPWVQKRIEGGEARIMQSFLAIDMIGLFLCIS